MDLDIFLRLVGTYWACLWLLCISESHYVAHIICELVGSTWALWDAIKGTFTCASQKWFKIMISRCKQALNVFSEPWNAPKTFPVWS